MKYQFYSDCVSWPGDAFAPDSLCYMIDNSVDISRKTFLKYINRDELKNIEESLGYSQHHKQGLIMANDYHVSYHRSKVYGKRCYYFRHSAIEYVFTN